METADTGRQEVLVASRVYSTIAQTNAEAKKREETQRIFAACVFCIHIYGGSHEGSHKTD